MANPTTRNQHCACRHGCPTWAVISDWDCGCRSVAIRNDRKAGDDCTRFSAMAHGCPRHPQGR